MSPSLPTGGPLEGPHGDGQSHRRKEPRLRSAQIQGNIVPGFLKDFQSMLFLRITDPRAFCIWLCELIPRIATLEEVAVFNRLFKALTARHGSELAGVKTTWVNVAISFSGLEQIAKVHPTLQLHKFRDKAFKQGLNKRSKLLGDPVDPNLEGHPNNWRVGGPKNEAHLVLIVASDSERDLLEEVSWLERAVYAFADGDGKRHPSGVEVIFKQDGATLQPPLTGHEHFGFRDGISQPGIRGILPDGTLLTPSQNPRDRDQGKPGQDLLWPGEFLFGYPGQDPNRKVDQAGSDPLKSAKRGAPAWARDGSFLVFRRLRQDVGMFHQFVKDVSIQFQVPPDKVGALMVGRWPSGAPTVSSPGHDDPRLAADDCRNNNFEFEPGGKPTPGRSHSDSCTNVPPPDNDPTGDKCPFAGHIRKAYPRNDTSPTIKDLREETTQTHRLLRRGIPYGTASTSTFTAPCDDLTDRGLLFLAYQVSIVDQFEFVTRNWINDENFKEECVGHDPIIGQNGVDRTRHFRINLPGATQPLRTDKEWVITTAGGYFFAPSIDALNMIARPPVAADRTRSRTGAAPNRRNKRKVRGAAKSQTTRKRGTGRKRS